MHIGLGIGVNVGRSGQVLPAWVTTDNLFTSPTDLSTGWSRTAIAAHSTATGYAGETANVMQEDSTAASAHGVSQSVNVTSGVTYIMRALVKAGAGTRNYQQSFPAARFTSGTAATFSLSGGGVLGSSNSPDTAVTALGDGYYVVSITKAATSTGAASILVRMHNGAAVTYDGDGTSSIIITAIGLHVVPPAVLPDWVNTDNLVTGATDLNNAFWALAAATVGDGAGIGYAGAADTLIEDGTNAIHSVRRNSYSFTSGTTYIMRAIVARGSGSRDAMLVLPAAAFGSATSAVFVLSGSGSVGTTANSPTTSIVYLGLGHYEISIQKAATATTAGTVDYRMATTAGTYQGDSTSSLVVSALGLHVVS